MPKIDLGRIIPANMSPDRVSNMGREGFSPKDEWELGKLQIRTLVDSGALAFLEKLKNTLELDPTLSKAVIPVGEFPAVYGRYNDNLPLRPHMLKVGNHIDKLFYVVQPEEVSQIAKLDRGSELQQFRIAKHKDRGNWYAAVEFWYNPREDDFAVFDKDDRPWRPPKWCRSACPLFDILEARCGDPGKVHLIRRTNDWHYEGENMGRSLAEGDWRRQGVLPKAFMDLYKQRPARSLNER